MLVFIDVYKFFKHEVRKSDDDYFKLILIIFSFLLLPILSPKIRLAKRFSHRIINSDLGLFAAKGQLFHKSRSYIYFR
jgi:hypothetical protein